MQTDVVKVTGMTCGGCTSNVTSVLKAVTGVADATVSLSDGKATVQYDERLTSPEKLRSAVEGAGYGVDTAPSPKKAKGKGCCCS